MSIRRSLDIHHFAFFTLLQHTCCCKIKCETKEVTMRRLEDEFADFAEMPGAAGICVTAERADIKVRISRNFHTFPGNYVQGDQSHFVVFKVGG